jgi:hypothetical protein
MKKIRIKSTVVDPFLVSHQADLTANNASVIARYVEIVANVEIIIENRFVVVEHEFYWDGTQEEFNTAFTENLTEAMNKFKREIAHSACLDTILQKRTV